MTAIHDSSSGGNEVPVAAPSLPVTAICPLCDHQGASQLFFSRDRVHHLPGTFGVYRCVECHALFIQPWLSETKLAAYYPQEYGRYRHGRSLEKKLYRGWQRFVLENYYGYPSTQDRHTTILKKALALPLSFVTARDVIPFRGTGRILDVGCGGGSYLYRLKQWGWETYGIEPSETGVEQAQQLGLNVFHGTLIDNQFENSFFDVIRLSNVLEHLRDPKAVFHAIDRILKPDGRVYVTVPNTKSLAFWLFQENWYGLDSPRHVISYCPRTLHELCNSTGFEIEHMHFASGPFNFVRSVSYWLEQKGNTWPRGIRNLDWSRNKLIRRTLKPFFFFVDNLGYGDFLHATIRKKPSSVQRLVLSWPAHPGGPRELPDEQTA